MHFFTMYSMYVCFYPLETNISTVIRVLVFARLKHTDLCQPVIEESSTVTVVTNRCVLMADTGFSMS